MSVLLALGALALGGAFWARIAHVDREHRRAADSLGKVASNARSHFASLPIRRFDPRADSHPNTLSSWKSMFAAAEIEGTDESPGIAAATREALIDAAAHFVMNRFAASGPEEYIAYRRANGASFRDERDARQMGLHTIFRMLTGTPWGDGLSTEAAFRDAWAAYAPNPSHPVLVGLSADPRGMAITVREMGEFDQSVAVPSRGVGHAGWRGIDGGCAPQWFEVRPSILDMTKGGRKVRSATFAVVGEFSNGVRHPIALGFVRHPEDGRWRLHHVCFWNTPDGHTTPFPF
jgi:hypothetical protein